MGNATSVIVYTNYNKIGVHWKGYNDCKGRVRQSHWKGLGDAKKDKEVELTMALSQRITRVGYTTLQVSNLLQERENQKEGRMSGWRQLGKPNLYKIPSY